MIYAHITRIYRIISKGGHVTLVMCCKYSMDAAVCCQVLDLNVYEYYIIAIIRVIRAIGLCSVYSTGKTASTTGICGIKPESVAVE